MSLANLPNLGPKSAEMLNAAGFQNPTQLEQAGAVPAFLAVKHAGFRPSLNLLWAIAGALNDIHWRQLPTELKQELLAELDRNGP